ncbi:winged helix-turn-helix domain-containing protein [Natrarchaeobaculum sulfurireducens]|uniref:winged helix-turn-helix domain-containing protein n=1 Tax=Natrarchaeobaculum sulfurireducens TaxID=2044521 RepID=UPI000E3CCBBE|nr:winged helix-turn-helix domain-containing protein [Natrarchaeobaculum sulfurireducens]
MSLTLTDAKRRILSHLADEPQHGYTLAKDLSVQGSTMYQHLNELEEANYIEGKEDGRRKVYTLTKKGQLIIEAENI